MFNQDQIQEFKEAFNMIDHNRCVGRYRTVPGDISDENYLVFELSNYSGSGSDPNTM